jgi:hypothetical protein
VTVVVGQVKFQYSFCSVYVVVVVTVGPVVIEVTSVMAEVSHAVTVEIGASVSVVATSGVEKGSYVRMQLVPSSRVSRFTFDTVRAGEQSKLAEDHSVGGGDLQDGAREGEIRDVTGTHQNRAIGTTADQAEVTATVRAAWTCAVAIRATLFGGYIVAVGRVIGTCLQTIRTTEEITGSSATN